ncbi:hypothetical protein GCM10020255_036590 [Rhodococcus baikonurensis]
MSSRTMLGKASTLVGAAAALTIAASGIATASTTISPAAATPVTATSSGLSFVTTGGLELYCTSVSGSGTTPAAPGNVNSGTGGSTSTLPAWDCPDVTSKVCLQQSPPRVPGL